MRVALLLVLALHGAIHLLGFLRWSGLARVPQLSAKTLMPLSNAGSRVFAVAWLTALVVFFVAGTLVLLKRDAWGSVAVFGVILSQALIVLAWRDAKAGTVANLIILIPALIAIAHGRFVTGVEREVREILADAEVHASHVTEDELSELPQSVRVWLTTSRVVGRDRAQLVRLRQEGELRTTKDGPWMPARAEQYFTVDPPTFVWKVETSMLGFLPISGRDRYANGKGAMRIEAGSLVPVVDVANEKIDQGAMLRFLGEIVWFPSAALSPNISWVEESPTSARATMRHAGREVGATFSFDDRGRITTLRAPRYLGGDESAKLERWRVSCREWAIVRGVQIPVAGDVAWDLEAGEFVYYRWRIVDVEENVRGLYDDAPSASPVLPRANAEDVL